MNIEHNQMIDVYVGSPTPDSIECQSTLPPTALIFEDHFPENPVLPGALLIEMMAQAATFIHLLKSDFESMAYLSAVKPAKLRAYTRPGETLLIRVQVTHWGERSMACDASAACTDGRMLGIAKLTLRFEPFASQRMRDAYVKLLSGGRPGPLCHPTPAPLATQTKEFTA